MAGHAKRFVLRITPDAGALDKCPKKWGTKMLNRTLWGVLAILLASAEVATASPARFGSLLNIVQLIRSGGEEEQTPPAVLDCSEVDAAFQAFLDGSLVFDGISYVVVDADTTLHTATFGNHTEDLVVMLASTSEVPAVK